MAPRVCGLSFHRLHHEFNVWPDGCAGPDSLGKTPHDDADFDLAHDHGPSDLAGGRCAMNENRTSPPFSPPTAAAPCSAVAELGIVGLGPPCRTRAWRRLHF